MRKGFWNLRVEISCNDINDGLFNSTVISAYDIFHFPKLLTDIRKKCIESKNKMCYNSIYRIVVLENLNSKIVVSIRSSILRDFTGLIKNDIFFLLEPSAQINGQNNILNCTHTPWLYIHFISSRPLGFSQGFLLN